MKLQSVRIENFRSFRDGTIQFDDYTCMVGPNGTGKSAVLTALNIFFRNNAATPTDLLTLSEEDFHKRNIEDPVKITLKFVDLSEAAQQDFKHYYRQGKLVVSAKAEWNPEERNAPVLQHGSRMVMKAFSPFFEAEDQKARVDDLRKIYAELRAKHADLPHVSTKDRMTNALREYEETHPENCELVEDTNDFYGWTRGQNRLAKYVQWVCVPAVKDASTEQDEGARTALGQLLQRTIRAKTSFDDKMRALKEQAAESYGEMIKAERGVLAELQSSIQKRLQQWSNPRARLELKWRYDPDTSVVVKEPNARAAIGEDAFVGEVPRLGHGMQRAFLVSMLQELAECGEGAAPTLLLGFEEPELYQHPPQAQHMAHLFDAMTGDRDSNRQIIITTHSPYFVPGRGYESVRMFRRRSNEATRIAQAKLDEVNQRLTTALHSSKPTSLSNLLARIEQILQPSQRELFFTPVPVLVEGLEDVAFISTYLHLADLWTDFRRAGCHFIVCEGKTSMSRLLAIALQLKMDPFVVFDADTDVRRGRKDRNARDNLCILRLYALRDPELANDQDFWTPHLVMWRTELAKRVRDDFGAHTWDEARQAAKTDYMGMTEGDEISPKNQLIVAYTLEKLYESGKRSPTLQKLCEAILAHAKETEG